MLCECESTAKIMVTLLDSTSLDATVFCCWQCAFAILDDWAVTEDPEVPGWIVEWLV